MAKTVAFLFIGSLAMLVMGTITSAVSKPIDYVIDPVERAFVIDSRFEEKCSEATLVGARCLPANEFLAGHRRLANISGMLWLLGTVGLTGKEHVLVVGDRSADKEFVAGLLYMAGQAKVSVLAKPLTKMVGSEYKMQPGTPRSTTRETVYQALMRDKRIVLRSELIALMKADNALMLLDGRSDREYWGGTIRAARGGHVPGAQSLPLRKLRPAVDRTSPVSMQQTVVYGHDSYEGLIYLARLVATGHVPKLYLEGWVGWASDGALPADALSYPGRSSALRKAIKRPSIEARLPWPLLALSLLAGMALASGGFWLVQRTTRN